MAAASEIARSHEVTELIQTAAKARMRGDKTAEQAALEKAAGLDPKNIEVLEHLHEMAADVADAQTSSLYGKGLESLGAAPILEPTADKHSFHLKSDRRQIIQTVFRSYGIDASVDQTVTGPPVRFDIGRRHVRAGDASREHGDRFIHSATGCAPCAGGEGHSG